MRTGASFLTSVTFYAVRNSDARVIATAATLPHDGKFAWISMVLVSADYRRQGLASRLMRRCIDDLTTSGLIPVLDATPDGRAVYRALGFQDIWGYHRMALHTRPIPPNGSNERIEVHSITDLVWPSLCRLRRRSLRRAARCDAEERLRVACRKPNSMRRVAEGSPACCWAAMVVPQTNSAR